MLQTNTASGMTLPLRPLITVCRGNAPHERNIRIVNRFWIAVDLLNVRRRLHAFVLGIVLTTNVILPSPVLAQILEEIPAAENEESAGEAEIVAASEDTSLKTTFDSLSGTVFSDANGNGVQDSDEAGLPDIAVELSMGGTRIASMMTSATGAYTFSNLTLVPEDFGEVFSTAVIALLDIDGDKDSDLITGNRNWEGNRLYRNDEGMLLDAEPILNKSNTGSFASTEAFAFLDTTGGGVKDIIVGGSDGNELFLSDGNSHFTFAGTRFNGGFTGETIGMTRALLTFDANDDGEDDFLVANGLTSTNDLYLSSGEGSFQFLPGIFSDAEAAANTFALIDIDGDKDDDLLIGTDGLNALYLQDGKKVKEEKKMKEEKNAPAEEAAEQGVMAEESATEEEDVADELSYHFAGFRFNQGFTGSTAVKTNVFAFPDIDADGDKDIVVANDGPNELYVNEGEGVFSYASERFNGGSRTVTVLDIDGDTDDDLFFGNNGRESELYVNSEGTFQGYAINAEILRNTEASLATDIYGDKDTDLLLGNEGAKSQILRSRAGKYLLTISGGTLPAGQILGDTRAHEGKLTVGVHEEGHHFPILPTAIMGSASVEGRIFSDSITVDGKDAPEEAGLSGIRVSLKGKTSFGNTFEAEAVRS